MKQLKLDIYQMWIGFLFFIYQQDTENVDLNL